MCESKRRTPIVIPQNLLYQPTHTKKRYKSMLLQLETPTPVLLHTCSRPDERSHSLRQAINCTQNLEHATAPPVRPSVTVTCGGHGTARIFSAPLRRRGCSGFAFRLRAPVAHAIAYSSAQCFQVRSDTDFGVPSRNIPDISDALGSRRCDCIYPG